jgi:hypothetical protein
MKWQSAVTVLLIPLIFSCRKETPQADARPKITNPTDYLLISQTWTGPTTNGLSYTLSYNDQNLLSDVEGIQWCCGTTADGDTTYSHFEYSNGLCQKFTIIHQGGSGSIAYEYNSRNLPVKMNAFTGTTYYYTNIFEYDSEDRLIKVTDSSWQLNYIYEYSYDDQTNPAMETVRNMTDSSITKNQWTSYDDKINYTKAVNGLPPGALFTGDFNGNFSSMIHNVLASNYTTTIFPYSYSSPGIFQYQYQYQYNEQGLPTQIVDGPWIITNIYRKYK